jgi:hypothetical protein
MRLRAAAGDVEVDTGAGSAVAVIWAAGSAASQVIGLRSAMASSALFVETLPFVEVAEPSPPAYGYDSDTYGDMYGTTYPETDGFVPEPPPAPVCNRSQEIVTVPSEAGGTRQIKIIRCP